MRKFILFLALAGIFLFPSGARAEGKFIVNGTNGGQFSDLAITGAGATTTKSGLKGTIDLNSLAQTDATLTSKPVIALSQSATTAPVFGFTCTANGTYGPGTALADIQTCSTYTSTIANKAGSIKILVNGVYRFLPFYNNPS